MGLGGVGRTAQGTVGIPGRREDQVDPVDRSDKIMTRPLATIMIKSDICGVGLITRRNKKGKVMKSLTHPFEPYMKGRFRSLITPTESYPLPSSPLCGAFSLGAL